MDVALMATRWMIWLNALVLVVLLIAWMWSGDSGVGSTFVGNGWTTALIVLVYLGLRRQYLWVGILFAFVCVVDILGAVTSGLTPMNALNLVDAVLSFVFIAGVVKWIRERPARA